MSVTQHDMCVYVCLCSVHRDAYQIRNSSVQSTYLNWSIVSHLFPKKSRANTNLLVCRIDKWCSPMRIACDRLCIELTIDSNTMNRIETYFVHLVLSLVLRWPFVCSVRIESTDCQSACCEHINIPSHTTHISIDVPKHRQNRQMTKWIFLYISLSFIHFRTQTLFVEHCCEFCSNWINEPAKRDKL